MSIRIGATDESLSQPYRLANDSEMRLLLAYGKPPRAGRIVDVTGGRYSVEIADGEDVTLEAIALNGFDYAVGSVVYVLQAANAPDSGVIIGRNGYAEKLAVGAATPDGALHVEDVVGGFIVVSAYAIDGTAQTLVSSRISTLISGNMLVAQGKACIVPTLTLTVPTLSYNSQTITIAGTTLQFRLYASGELQVVRTAGVGTPSVVLRALWL